VNITKEEIEKLLGFKISEFKINSPIIENNTLIINITVVPEMSIGTLSTTITINSCKYENEN
jgi:hypothetical protein